VNGDPPRLSDGRARDENSSTTLATGSSASCFTWLLEQPIRDTLCGTRSSSSPTTKKIKAGRKHFGEFDPFGDFDLLFGAARLRLPIVEVPVRYKRRLAGVSKVRVSQHGWLLVGMSMIAFRRLKLAKWTGKLPRRKAQSHH